MRPRCGVRGMVLAGSSHCVVVCRGSHPTEIAAVLLCSRSSVYRTVRAGVATRPALTPQTKRGLTVSAETMRRWLHEVVWPSGQHRRPR